MSNSNPPGGNVMKPTATLVILLITVALLQVPSLRAQSSPEISEIMDIRFASIDGQDLLLDLYLPEGVRRPPLLVFVHGGAWRLMSRTSSPVDSLVSAFVPAGFALASVDFRLSEQARFPAQIHDIKAAIRFLRARQADFGISADNIVALGNSSGGHLVAVLGTADGIPDLEGRVGDFLDVSSSIQGVVSYYGASNLTTILAQSTPHGIKVREPALELLLGGHPDQQESLARLASPVFHVGPGAAPILLLHGDQDSQMPINQAHELEGAYLSAQRPVKFEVVHGAAHGGAMFHDEPRNTLVLEFLNAVLRP